MGYSAVRRPMAPLIVTSALALSAVVQPAGAVTLRDFVIGVVENHPEVREQVHRYRQTRQDSVIARSGWRPSIDVGAGLGLVTRKAANTAQRREDYDTAQADVTLTQNLFKGYDTTHAVKQARARVESAAHQIIDTADNIALDAVRAYVTVLTERRLVELAAQNVESHDRILGQIRELGEQGITRRSDVEQTEGRLARAHASLIAQQNNLQDALTELHTVSGRYIDASELVEVRAPDRIGDAVDDVIATALAAHPAIASAQSNVRAAASDYQRSKRTDLPQLDLQLQQVVGNDVDGPNGHSEEGSVMLTLRYNLYRGGADRAEQRKKTSVVQENKAFLDRVRRQVIDTVRLAWAADQALAGQIPFLDRHVEKSLETVELYREEYLLLRRDLIDVLDAEGELNRALISEAEARYDAIVARFRVVEGAGALLPALGMDVSVDEHDIRIASIAGAALDVPEPAVDRDADGTPDAEDHCASSVGGTVDARGCGVALRFELGYEAIPQEFGAVDDHFTTSVGEPLVLTPSMLFENDPVSGSDSREVRRFGEPAYGAVTRDAEGNLVYTPRSGHIGEDGFTYTVGDRRARNATAKVLVQVVPPPVPDPIVVRFEYKKRKLTVESERRIDEIVETLALYPARRVEIIAFTDNIGSRGYNRRLSQRRANALKRILVRRGVAAGRIDSLGLGESSPIADNATEAGRAMNRRAEIRYLQP